MRGLRTWAGALMGVMLVSGAACAARLQVPLAGTDVITSERGEARILAVFEPLRLPGLSDAWVTTAYLEIPLRAGATERLDVQVYSVPTAWARGTVTWTTPWRTPGGDMEGSVPSVDFDGSDRSGRLIADVTSLVQGALARGDTSARFLLTVPAHLGAGFGPEARQRLGALDGATLNVMYARAGSRRAAVALGR